jgi:hypothetical protein
MVAIILAAIGKDVPVGLIPSRVEQSAWRPVTCYTFTFEIVGVPREWRCPELCALMPDNPHLDNDAPIIRPARMTWGSHSATPEAGSAATFAVRTVSPSTAPAATAFVRRTHDLTDEGLGLAALCPAVAGPSRSDLELVVSVAHRPRNPQAKSPARRRTAAKSAISEKEAGRLLKEPYAKAPSNQPYGPSLLAVLLSCRASFFSLLPQYLPL